MTGIQKNTFSSEDYGFFKRLVLDKFGIKLTDRDYNKISRMILTRIRKLKTKSVSNYLKILESDLQENEWQYLIDGITVSETYFFRDQDQCSAIKEYILPRIIKVQEKRHLKIWSVGCSTGEEPYTMAILISQIIPDLKKWTIEITGTDLNPGNISMAEKGLYRNNSFRGVKQEIIANYFKKKGDSFLINNHLRDNVKFDCFNIELAKGKSFPDKFHNFDVIICRNVLIYFEKNAIRNILAGFKKALHPQGYLVLGHSEFSLVPKKDFQTIQTNNTFIYTHRKPSPEKEVNKKPCKQKKGILTSVKANDHIQIPGNKNQQKIITGSPQSKSLQYQNALNLYLQEDYTEALEAINLFLKQRSGSSKGIILAILIHINLGNYEKGYSLIHSLKNQDEFLPDIPFLTGLIHENQQEYNQAIKAYKTALFLKGNYFFSYFRLGAIYFKLGKVKPSIHAYQNALKVLIETDQDKIRVFCGGFSVKNIEEMCIKGSNIKA